MVFETPNGAGWTINLYYDYFFCNVFERMCTKRIAPRGLIKQIKKIIIISCEQHEQQ